VDPFFVPTTEEDREEYGEEGQGVGECLHGHGALYRWCPYKLGMLSLCTAFFWPARDNSTLKQPGLLDGYSISVGVD
jgi:hypothetical protein